MPPALSLRLDDTSAAATATAVERSEGFAPDNTPCNALDAILVAEPTLNADAVLANIESKDANVLLARDIFAPSGVDCRKLRDELDSPLEKLDIEFEKLLKFWDAELIAFDILSNAENSAILD